MPVRQQRVWADFSVGDDPDHYPDPFDKQTRPEVSFYVPKHDGTTNNKLPPHHVESDYQSETDDALSYNNKLQDDAKLRLQSDSISLSFSDGPLTRREKPHSEEREAMAISAVSATRPSQRVAYGRRGRRLMSLPSAWKLQDDGSYQGYLFRHKGKWKKQWARELFVVQHNVLLICTKERPFLVKHCIPLVNLQKIEDDLKDDNKFTISFLAPLRKGKSRTEVINCRASQKTERDAWVQKLSQFQRRALARETPISEFVEKKPVEDKLRETYANLHTSSLSVLAAVIARCLINSVTRDRRAAFAAWRSVVLKDTLREANQKAVNAEKEIESRTAALQKSLKEAQLVAKGERALLMAADRLKSYQRHLLHMALLALKRNADEHATELYATGAASLMTFNWRTHAEMIAKDAITWRERRINGIFMLMRQRRLREAFDSIRLVGIFLQERRSRRMHTMADLLKRKEEMGWAAKRLIWTKWRNVSQQLRQRDDKLRSCLIAENDRLRQAVLTRWYLNVAKKSVFDVAAVTKMVQALRVVLDRQRSYAFRTLFHFTDEAANLESLQVAANLSMLNSKLVKSFNQLPLHRGAILLNYATNQYRLNQCSWALYQLRLHSARERYVKKRLEGFMAVMNSLVIRHHVVAGFNSLVTNMYQRRIDEIHQMEKAAQEQSNAELEQEKELRQKIELEMADRQVGFEKVVEDKEKEIQRRIAEQQELLKAKDDQMRQLAEGYQAAIRLRERELEKFKQEIYHSREVDQITLNSSLKNRRDNERARIDALLLQILRRSGSLQSQEDSQPQTSSPLPQHVLRPRERLMLEALQRSDMSHLDFIKRSVIVTPKKVDLDDDDAEGSAFPIFPSLGFETNRRKQAVVFSIDQREMELKHSIEMRSQMLEAAIQTRNDLIEKSTTINDEVADTSDDDQSKVYELSLLERDILYENTLDDKCQLEQLQRLRESVQSTSNVADLKGVEAELNVLKDSSTTKRNEAHAKLMTAYERREAELLERVQARTRSINTSRGLLIIALFFQHRDAKEVCWAFHQLRREAMRQAIDSREKRFESKMAKIIDRGTRSAIALLAEKLTTILERLRLRNIFAAFCAMQALMVKGNALRSVARLHFIQRVVQLLDRLRIARLAGVFSWMQLVLLEPRQQLLRQQATITRVLDSNQNLQEDLRHRQNLASIQRRAEETSNAIQDQNAPPEGPRLSSRSDQPTPKSYTPTRTCRAGVRRLARLSRSPPPPCKKASRPPLNNKYNRVPIKPLASPPRKDLTVRPSSSISQFEKPPGRRMFSVMSEETNFPTIEAAVANALDRADRYLDSQSDEVERPIVVSNRSQSNAVSVLPSPNASRPSTHQLAPRPQQQSPALLSTTSFIMEPAPFNSVGLARPFVSDQPINNQSAFESDLYSIDLDEIDEILEQVSGVTMDTIVPPFNKRFELRERLSLMSEEKKFTRNHSNEVLQDWRTLVEYLQLESQDDDDAAASTSIPSDILSILDQQPATFHHHHHSNKRLLTSRYVH